MNKKVLLMTVSAITTSLLSPAQQTKEAFEKCKEAMEEQIRIPLDKISDYLNATNIESTTLDAGKTEAGDILVSGTINTENEVHAIINPKDETNIITSPLRNQPGVALQMPVYFTKNNGVNWYWCSTFNPMPRRTGG